MNPTETRRPTCVAVINLKGGVGKTTITALLGRHAADRWGLNVLAVDLDPQANLSQAYMRDMYRQFLESKAPSIVEVFSGMRPPGPGRTSPAALCIEDAVFPIPSQGNHGSISLIPSRFDFSTHLTDAIKLDEKKLARCIAEHFLDKDLILIDCAPTESVFTNAAYHASRHVLVPVRPEFFATIGFPLLKQSLDAFRSRNRGHAIDVVGVAINNAFYDGGNRGGPEKQKAMFEIRDEAQANGWRIFDHEVEHSRGYPKLMRGEYRWSGNAAYFSHFANEFLEQLGMLPVAR